MISDMTTSALFETGGSIALPYILKHEYPWAAIPYIKDIILEIARSLPPEEYYCPEEGVWISREADVSPSAYIGAPTIIMKGASLRHCAFIRSSALIGEGAVIGNSCEIKNSIIFNGAQIPHFNYVGDSIIGRGSHLGAGAVTSNVKSDKTSVTVRCAEEKINTELKKLGAVLGDGVEIGCGAVLNPGTVIGRGSTVYPQCAVRGFIPPNSIYKKEGEILEKFPVK